MIQYFGRFDVVMLSFLIFYFQKIEPILDTHKKG
jgi:hypothetical protein